jgi:hypothetical protein
LAFAITQNIAPVISISYGVCESLMSASELNQGNSLFEQAAAQVAAAGTAALLPVLPTTLQRVSRLPSNKLYR